MFPVRRFDINQEVKVPVLKKDKSNISDFFAVDTVGNKAPVMNYGGWHRNDLAMLNAQTDMSVAKAMALQLHQSDDVDLNAGKSDAEIMLHAKSKYIQSPSEMIGYIENEISIRDQRLARAAQVAADAKAAAASKKAMDDLKDSLTPEEREEVRAATRKKQINKLVK